MAGNNDWLRGRVGEVLGLHYAVPWPNRELETGRPLRRSPVHDLVVAQGACLGSRNNWERPNVFAPQGVPPVIEYSWERPTWVDWSVAEQRATREAVAVFDQTSFSKYLVVGPDAERALQWVCTADVGGPEGRSVYTGMLNSLGTYESDVTVTRVAADEFFVVSSAATTVRDIDWMRRHFPADAPAHVVDLTSAYAVFGVMGPRSRELLERLSPDAFDDASFPFATSREVRIGSATVRATRITYVGELGWELYVPTDLAAGVYEDLFSAGARPRRRPGGLLHDRGDAPGEGLPRLCPRADHRDRAGGRRAHLRVQAARPTSTSWVVRPSRTAVAATSATDRVLRGR